MKKSVRNETSAGLRDGRLAECFLEMMAAERGAARNTIQFLEGLYHGLGPGGRSVVEATFDNIRKQKTPGLR